MSRWKLPPKAKVYEALGAVLDGRVRVTSDSSGEVTSSGVDKVYKVRWVLETNQITSSDPASRFQGYIGYPIIAVLLETKRLAFDPDLAAPLKGIPWKAINDRFKRNYDLAVSEALKDSGDTAALVSMVEGLYTQLEALQLEKPERS
ncbi:MAG TPA: hypothetical protein VK934_13220 [Fimbriimonas sp.]|nr:hypothetical protein [Fimbriimonas sp.]